MTVMEFFFLILVLIEYSQKNTEAGFPTHLVQFSRVQLFVTPLWNAVRQASLSITNYRNVFFFNDILTFNQLST